MQKLTNLEILEVSGVDQPATELDGWMIQKAAKSKAAKAALADAIRRSYGLPDSLGRFAARGEINLDENGTSTTTAGDESSGPSLPWRHLGARIVP
jgi:hypothetical protein